MCGIAGVFQKDEMNVPFELVEKMGITMNHRGPDNFGLKRRRNVVMAHNRLSLLDLSVAANQPFNNERYSLIFNGEIYNFKEIRKRLEQDFSVQFFTTSDTEVLFTSLIHDGIDKCLSQIKGMYAFAFYDEQANILWLARDRMGIKPLYYYEKQDSFYWSSEIKAIAKALELKPDPIRTLFAVNNMAEKSTEYTLFKGISSVKPGSYLKIENCKKLTETVYYDVLEDFDKDYYNYLNGQSADSIVNTFDKMFNNSVESMLISDAPIGAFVSGGIDSSLISAVATKFNADIKLFTANVIGKYSEYADVEILSKYLKKEVFDYKFEPQMMLRDWAEATYYYENPIVIHVNSIPFSNVARLARDKGVKAVLTGEGADELFLGYPRLLTKRYEDLASFPVKAIKSIYQFYPNLDTFLFPKNENTPVSFINRLVQGFELQKFQDKADNKLSFLNETKRNEQFLTINMVREHLVTLLHRNDRMGMMSSIEARFPFLDENIIKFAVNLPSKFKIGRTHRFYNYKHPFLVDKWIVRKIAEKYLPNSLVKKKKNGFPMFGHKFVKIKYGFFEKGWVADSLGLKTDSQNYLIKSQDPYHIAKLASVEIFGRIFALNESLESIKEHILKFAEIINF